MQIYVVEPGDTIDSIAERFSVTVEEISYVNQIPAPYSLAVGQALLVQTEGVSADRGRYSKGYAYPFISRWVLEQTLPYLSSLLIFSYGFNADGQIVYPVGDDEWMIALANDYGVNPVLVLTPIGEDGTFDNNRIHSMLSNIEARDRLIREVTDVVNAKGYRGVDVDFEYILREDRDSFTEFVALLTQTMNNIGIEVSVCLAPKTSADQPGLLYEGKDYRGLGEAANEVLLMTYEWGYTYGPPMAVAPLNKVRQVVEYALTEIPPEKICIGIANYGYDWTLPFVKGESKATTIGNVEAVQIAIRNDTDIEFAPVSESPFFNYISAEREHEVWFEDVRSLRQKYALVDEFGLKGIGVWQLMRLYRAMWYEYFGNVPV